MKIALLLCGQYRTLLDKRVLDAQNSFIEKFNVDVFLATWSDPGISVWDMFQKNPDNYSGIKVDSDVVSKLNNLVKYEIYNFENYVNKIDDNLIQQKLRNFTDQTRNNSINEYGKDRFITGYPQLYTIYKANQMKIKYEISNNFKYDIVIKSRPDFLFFQDVTKYIETSYQNTDSIYTLNPANHYWPNRIYDIMFFSSSKNIDKLAETYLDYSHLTKQSISEKIKIMYGNKLGRKIDNSTKLGFVTLDNKKRFTNHLRALESTDPCRLLYQKSNIENFKLNEITDDIGEVVRVGNIDDLLSK